MHAQYSLLPHWQREAQIFHQKISLVARRLHHGAIHDARVAMKKLRSYARLSDKVMRTSLRAAVLPFATLYLTCGACRDTYNAIRLLEAFTHRLDRRFPLFEAYLKISLQASARYLHKVFTILPISESDWQLLSQPQGLSERISLQTLRAMQDETRALWESVEIPASDRNAEALHDLRKALKQLFYWLEVVPASDSFAFYDLKALRALNSLFGKWQDLHQLERRVQLFRQELLGKDTPERRDLKLLLKALAQEKRKLYGTMTDKLSVLLEAQAK